MECQEFVILPPDEEVAQFIFEEVLKEQENKELFKQVESLYSDESARKFLVRMSSDESAGRLADLLVPGVTWPGYRNEEKNRDVIVHGYSMEKPVMDITLSGIGWWTTEAVIKSVVGTWGEIKDMSQKKTTYQNHTISTDKWMIKLVKKKEVTIPPVVVHAGSTRSSDEKEVWKVFYRGVVKVCYRCLKEGHLGRDCQDINPVSMEFLASQPQFESAPVAPTEEEVISGVKKTFAQIVKDASFIAARQVREEAAEKLRKEKAVHEKEVREAREERDKKRREKRNLETRLSRDFSLTTDNDSDEEIMVSEKRPLPSPKEAGPDKKTSRHRSVSRTPSQGGGGSRGKSPGH
jgi:hypothetical protein